MREEGKREKEKREAVREEGKREKEKRETVREEGKREGCWSFISDLLWAERTYVFSEHHNVQ